MTSSSRRALSVATLLAFALGAAPALAQRTAQDVESARELYGKGRELRDHGDLAGALEKFKAAHALVRTPITGLDLARTYAALGLPVEAREVCLGIARTPVSAEETPRSAEARNEAAKLAEEVKPRIATLRFRIQGVPAGAEPTLLIDGAAVPPAAIGEPRKVNPGAHTMVARVGNGPETKGNAEVKAGEEKVLDITVVAPPDWAEQAARGPERGAPAPRQKMSPFVITGFSIAAVGLGVGAITGGLAISAKGDLDSACPGHKCGPDAHDTHDRATLLGDVSTVAFIIGAAGAALGVYGLSNPVRVTPQSGRFIQPVVGLGRVGIDGSF